MTSLPAVGCWPGVGGRVFCVLTVRMVSLFFVVAVAQELVVTWSASSVQTGRSTPPGDSDTLKEFQLCLQTNIRQPRGASSTIYLIPLDRAGIRCCFDF